MKFRLVLLVSFLSLGLMACQNNSEKKTSEAGESESLSEISENSETLSEQDCEDKFKNENGICEVPNHPHPEAKKGDQPK